MTRKSPSYRVMTCESSEFVNESDDSVTRVIKLLTSHERLDDSSSRVRDL